MWRRHRHGLAANCRESPPFASILLQGHFRRQCIRRRVPRPAEGRERPICGRIDQPVLHRVLRTKPLKPGEAGQIVDPFGMIVGAPNLATYRAMRAKCESPPDLRPAASKICVPFRQPPNSVQMIGQDHPSLDPEGPFSPRQPNGLTQLFNLQNQVIIARHSQGMGKEDQSSRRRGEKMFHAHRLPHRGLTNPFL